jgi:hypothetical protein
MLDQIKQEIEREVVQKLANIENSIQKIDSLHLHFKTVKEMSDNKYLMYKEAII